MAQIVQRKHLVLTCKGAFNINVDPMRHDNEDCIAIVITEDGYCTSISHDSDDINPETRFNQDITNNEDWRGREEELKISFDEVGMKIESID